MLRNFSRERRPNARRGLGAGLKHDDDAKQMARLAAGDPGALRDLYEKHGRALLRFSSAMCRSRQSAEDLVHDTFVALLHGPSLFDPAQGSVFAYLCGVLRHRISRHYRQQQRWVALDTSDESDAQGHDPEPDEEIARSQVTAAFRRSLLELPLKALPLRFSVPQWK